MNNIIERVWNQGSMVSIEDLTGAAFQAESGGHTFRIRGVDANGNDLALSGTPAGVMLRADGQDVALTCSVSGGVVSATLPANAYVVPGRFGITIFLTSDGQKTAIYAAIGSVAKTSSGTVAPPAGSDVVDLVNAIAAAIAQIPATDTALKAAMAPTYSTSAVYPVGAYAWYNGTLYRCTTAITTGETWTSGHWTAAEIGTDLNNRVSDLNSALKGETKQRGYNDSLIATIEPTTQNLFDKNGAIVGFLTSDGTVSISVQGYDQYVTSDYFPVDPSTNYVAIAANAQGSIISAGNARKIYMFYDESKEPINNTYINSTDKFVTSTSPANSAYMRFCVLASAKGMVAEGTSVSTYKDYDYSAELNSKFGLTAKMASEADNSATEIVETRIQEIIEFTSSSANLVDPEKVVTGFINSDGSLLTSSSWSNYETSEYIPVDANTAYYIASFKKSDDSFNIGRRGYLIFDNTKTPISGAYVNDASTRVLTFTTPNNAAFIRVSVINTHELVLAKGTASETWIPFVKKGVLDESIGLNEKMVSEIEAMSDYEDNRFVGKKILNIGDSIAENVPARINYATQFAQKTGAILTTDYALGGSTLSLTDSQGTRGCIYSQALQAVTDHPSEAYDIIMIDGGTNDHNYGRMIGNVSGTAGQYVDADYEATFSTSTAIGALETIFKILRNQYTGSVIVFVLPHKNEHNDANWATLVTKIRDACEKWSIPIVDVYSKGELNARITAMRTDYTDSNGTHPNTLGIGKFYVPMLISVLEEHF